MMERSALFIHSSLVVVLWSWLSAPSLSVTIPCDIRDETQQTGVINWSSDKDIIFPCITWSFYGQPGDVITLRFTQLELQCGKISLLIGEDYEACQQKNAHQVFMLHQTQLNVRLRYDLEPDPVQSFSFNYSIGPPVITTPVITTAYPDRHTSSHHYPEVCEKSFGGTYGFIQTPPSHSSCVYHISVPSPRKAQLRFSRFHMNSDESYLAVYPGEPDTSALIGKYTMTNSPPRVITAPASSFTIIYHAGSIYDRFNATFQAKGQCVPHQQYNCMSEEDCYETGVACDGVWDCPIYGHDEIGCGKCNKLYWCGPLHEGCYSFKDRCDGQQRCSVGYADELNCSSEQCGPHNGTYRCQDAQCIPENWVCDGTPDCSKGEEERNCPLSRKVVLAGIVGSLTCSLLLVIALGCTYKLHMERSHDSSSRAPRRHTSPLTQVQEAIMARRPAPPAYLEAMQTSRPFDEVQREILMHRAANSGGGATDDTGSVEREVNQVDSSGEEPESDDTILDISGSPTRWVSDDELIDITDSGPNHTGQSESQSGIRLSTEVGQRSAQWSRHVPKIETDSPVDPSETVTSDDPVSACGSGGDVAKSEDEKSCDSEDMTGDETRSVDSEERQSDTASLLY